MNVPLSAQGLHLSLGPLYRDLLAAQPVAELQLRGEGKTAEEKTETLQ